jgi:hypothetical protein
MRGLIMVDGYVSVAGFRSHRNSHTLGKRAKTPYGNTVGTSIRFLCANTVKNPINTTIDSFPAVSIPVSRTKKSMKNLIKTGFFGFGGVGTVWEMKQKRRRRWGYI